MKSRPAWFLILAVAVAPCLAQAPAGEISGVVLDPSGSVVPGVTITVTNPATNATRVVQSNEA
ncbi:MAG: hypothetical protein DMG07_21910, partial [Acidobacteria bacterium]